MRFTGRVPLLGEYFCEVYEVSAFIWSLGFMMRFRDLLSECPFEVSGVYLEILCYEVHGVYEKSAFKRFMGFIRRAPLWALWPFLGLWTL